MMDKINSIWRDTAELPHFPCLEGDRRTGVLVIGGGMAGVLCACLLEQAGVDYLLVEAKRICSGVTGDTTAKLTSQHGLIYAGLVQSLGPEQAGVYLRANEEALQMYAGLCGEVSCEFERKDSYVYATGGHRQKLEQELAALEKIGYPASYVSSLSLPFETDGAVKFADQAQFHPLKFIAGIAGSLKLYENTRVTELGVGVAKTAYGTIRAEHIIIATHYPMDNHHGAYFMKLYQSRSYVLALSHAQEQDGMYVDQAKDGLSFRNYKNLLLLGGGGHRTGKDGGKWGELFRFAKSHYPKAVPELQWAAQDCMSLDGIPYIGRYGKHTEGLYVTSGYNKWGMTSAMVSAMLLRDLILGKENPCEQIFNPARSLLHPQLFVNLGEAAAGLIYPSARRCPHLGCALRWNPQEHSWDCPCHGSRFTEDGQVMDNPANGDLRNSS